MKRCPQCHEFFNNEDVFCLNDGAALEMAASDIPTQVISSPFLETGPKKTGGNRFYWIMGLMALIIVFLLGGVFVLLLRPMTTQTAETSNSNPDKVQNAASAAKPENTAPVLSNSAVPVQSSLPPVTAEEVKGLIERWEKAQDAQNFQIYQECYGQPFLGIKRTKTGHESRMSYGQWMNDRRKMLSQAVGLDVEVEDLRITIEGDTATAEFEQYYRSLKYSDYGPKILKIKRFSNGLKIVYEDLKASKQLN